MGSLVGLCLAAARQPKGARLAPHSVASRGPLSSRSPSLPHALLRPARPHLLLCGFEVESCFRYPGLGTAGATAQEVLVGVCWETATSQKLGLSCWDGQNGLEISPGPMCSIVFPLSPSSSWWLSGCQGRIRPFYILLFVAVDLGNCNLQDRFLPNPLENPHAPMQQPEACTAPCASPCTAQRGQQLPSCPGRGGPGNSGYRGAGTGTRTGTGGTAGRELHRFLITLLLQRRHV